jgi:hypothetical protein
MASNTYPLRRRLAPGTILHRRRRPRPMAIHPLDCPCVRCRAPQLLPGRRQSIILAVQATLFISWAIALLGFAAFNAPTIAAALAGGGQ